MRTSNLFRLGPCCILLIAGVLGGQSRAESTSAPEGPPNRHAGLAQEFLTRKIWEERIQAPASSRNPEASELKSLIARLRSVTFQPAPAPESQSVSEVNEAPQAQGTEPTPPPVGPTTLTGPVPEQPPSLDIAPARAGLSTATLAQIQKMADQTIDPRLALRLADVLYRSDYRDRATSFYQLATEGLDPNAPLAHEDRAWALFQLGNCLRESKPADAKLAYQRLTSEYPSSPWAAMAAMWHDLADWYWREQPMQTLAEVTQPQDAAIVTAPPAKGDPTP